MPFIRKPIVDQWYRHLDKGESFRVVAIDEDARTVELQDFDGDIEEIELDDWYGMDVEPIDPPEDCTGPLDDVERDDLGYTDTGTEAAEWSELTRDELARRLARREDVEEEAQEGGPEASSAGRSTV